MLDVEIQKRLQHFALNVHFSVSNEIIVLFGPSGSGKTTILNNIAGLVTLMLEIFVSIMKHSFIKRANL